MYSYVAYNLGISSALSLPELIPGDGETDVIVRLGGVGDLLPAPSISEHHYWANARMAYLFREDIGTCLVRGGQEIIVEPAPGVEERVLRLFILGPALAVLLHQRGMLVLHASAVEMNGGAVAFLGGAGWGKSTTAAALHARGHNIVADDVLAVQVDAGWPVAFPGFPQLKLWPESVVSLGDTPETLPRLHPDLEKRARRVAGRFAQEPLPLEQVYVLAEGESHEVEALRPQEALIELMRHSYAVRLLQFTGASTHFLSCAKLARVVPLHRLKRSYSLEKLPGLARMVEENLARGIA